MYRVTSIARRVTALSAAITVFAAVVLPTATVFADALNPLTERSLLLSSSAPGFQNTDGSGNSTYAPPGSGPNGQKTGETFTFKVSTDSSGAGPNIMAMTLQYCTGAAGNCRAPGDNTGDQRTTNREANSVAHPLGRSDLEVVGPFVEGTGDGTFQVFINGNPTTGWTMASINAEDTAHSEALTGKHNLIRLTHTTGIEPEADDVVTVVFRASDSVYITNPGSGAFFVKINTYNTNTVSQLIPAIPAVDNTNIIDGGVTVANVMTDSIHITTKVLETMAFSVGTRNRDTVTLNCEDYVFPATSPQEQALIDAGCEADDSGTVPHGTCDPIQQVNGNRLQLGDPDAEYSLQTDQAWSVYSYWRLSSNSSGGATVYYSGNTLANTVGDEIQDMPVEANSLPGTEQFGLGFVTPKAPSAEYTGQHPTRPVDSFPFRTLASQTTGRFDIGNLPNQTYTSQYDEAEGILGTDNEEIVSPSAKFKFLKSSLTVPEPIARQNEQVISCATAKMRYVGNIGADTPAGVYTTKINYLAAPQY